MTITLIFHPLYLMTIILIFRPFAKGDLKLTFLYLVMTIILDDHYTDLHPFAYGRRWLK